MSNWQTEWNNGKNGGVNDEVNGDVHDEVHESKSKVGCFDRLPTEEIKSCIYQITGFSSILEKILLSLLRDQQASKERFESQTDEIRKNLGNQIALEKQNRQNSEAELEARLEAVAERDRVNFASEFENIKDELEDTKEKLHDDVGRLDFALEDAESRMYEILNNEIDERKGEINLLKTGLEEEKLLRAQGN